MKLLIIIFCLLFTSVGWSKQLMWTCKQVVSQGSWEKCTEEYKENYKAQNKGREICYYLSRNIVIDISNGELYLDMQDDEWMSTGITYIYDKNSNKLIYEPGAPGYLYTIDLTNYIVEDYESNELHVKAECKPTE